jgi:photosystem II stability/assembly factor-like uncharacterized protein
MKHLFLLLLLLTGKLSAQEQTGGPVIPPGATYYEACAIAEAYFQRDRAAEQQYHPAFEDDAYTAYQRWKWMYAGRVDADGRVPDPALMYAERDARFPQNRSMVSPWVNISQDTSEGGYSNMGRTVCVAFDPTNANIIYTGSAHGGLWKTTDGGTTWSPLTDQLPYNGVTHCVVDPTSPNTIYIMVNYPYNWYTLSKGVYKSTDGGQTWNATGLSWIPSFNWAQYYVTVQMLIDPINPSTLYVATASGLFKTVNGGTTWNQLDTLYYSDLEFEPGTSNLYRGVYGIAGINEVYRSTDGAATWTAVSSFNTGYNYFRLAVTPANPAMLVVSGTTGNSLYVSTNYGSNLNYVSTLPENMVIAISPTNASVMYSGYLNIYKSTDTGASWNQITLWYANNQYDEIHADQRAVAYHPLVPDHIYFCNDGGLYHYAESSSTWTDHSDRLLITQFYRIAHSATDPMIIIGGTQDNGGRLRDNTGGWRPTNGGDAMEVAVDPVNDSVMYSTYTYGTLYRSLDRWTGGNVVQISYNIPGQPAGNWVTPYVLDPSDHNTIVAGYSEVWRSTDRGNMWIPLSNSLAPNATIEHLAVAPTDPNTIWISYGNTLKMTDNMGLVWNTITSPGTTNISSIIIHPADPHRVWITCNGYDAGNKVYYTANAGSTWTNISGALPNTPVNVGVYENGSTNVIYIGTDAGVFYSDSLNPSWQLLGTGLPNVYVTDLELFYPTRKVRAATYGRGIFETDMSSPLDIATPAAPASSSLTVYPNPNNGNFDVRFQSQSNSDVRLRVLDVFGKTVYETYATGNLLQHSITLPGVAAGTYFVLAEQDGKLSRSRVTVR